MRVEKEKGMKKRQEICGETLLQRDQNQLFTMVGGEVVMLNVKHEEYLNLNQHASQIWLFLESPHSFDELIDYLCSLYEVDREQCKQDTLEFVNEFREKQIIRIISI